jgi:hypothetical protein
MEREKCLHGRQISPLDIAQHEDRHQDANIAQVKDSIKDINGKIQGTGAVLNIKDVPSPARDPKVLDKDPKTNKYRAEWGPVLAQFIKDQINAAAQKENHIKVSVQVSWSQADFATGRAPYFNYTAAAIDPPNLTQ